MLPRAFDARSALTIRKARLLARFTFADAYALAGHTAARRARVDFCDPCPACGAAGLNFLRVRTPGQMAVLTDDLSAATRCVCSACGLSGDAAYYVQASGGYPHVTAALDAVEAWLSSPPSARRGPRT